MSGERAPLAIPLVALGAAGYFLLPGPAPAAAAAGLCILGAALRPLTGLQLLILTLPFYLLEKQAVTLPFALPEFVLLATLAGWAARRLYLLVRRRPEPLPPWRLPHPAILLFLAGALLASFAAVATDLHLRGLRILVLEPLLFYWLLRQEVKSRDDWLSLLYALLLSGVVVSSYAAWQFIFTTETIAAEGVDRARGIYGSPNNLGLYLGRIVPIALTLTLWAKSGRAIYGAALALMAVLLFLTFSIGAWLGTAAAVLFIALMTRHYRLSALMVLAGVAVVAGSFALDIERVTSHLDPQGSTWRFRGFVWQAGLEMLRDHPLLGIGIDNFLTHYQTYRSPHAWAEPNLSHPHNLLLDFWLNVGLLGAAGLWWTLASTWRRAVDGWRRLADPTLAAALLGIAAAVVDTVAHGLFDNAYFLIDLAFVFWLLTFLTARGRQPALSAIIAPPSAAADPERIP